MWPFSKKARDKPTPTIKVGETLIKWDNDFHWWEFAIDGEFYSLSDNPVFDSKIIDNLPKVHQWINDLETDIDKEVSKQLEGWCEWGGKKHVISIDVSWLIEKDQVDVSYAGDDSWGDFGINVVITGGEIDHVYAGD